MPAQRGWRGDEHALQVSAGAEAGLSPREVALRSFEDGFARGVERVSEVDGALVCRGRTILSREQLLGALEEVLARVGLSRSMVTLTVRDGEFALRVSRADIARAGASRPVDGQAGISVGIMLGMVVSAGALLLAGLASGPWSALMLLGLAGVAGTVHLTRARRLLATKLPLALGELAMDEGLVLPPAPANAPGEAR